MHESVDARVERTRALLADALTELLEQSTAPPVSVSAVCERAGVSRPTFYQHYRTPDDLLATAIVRRLAQVEDRTAALPDDGGVPPSLVSFLRELHDHRDLYGRVLGPDSPFGGTRATLERWLAGRMLEGAEHGSATGPDRRLRAMFVAGGMLSVVAHWLTAEGPPRPYDELGEDLWRTIRAVDLGA